MTSQHGAEVVVVRYAQDIVRCAEAGDDQSWPSDIVQKLARAYLALTAKLADREAELQIVWASNAGLTKDALDLYERAEAAEARAELLELSVKQALARAEIAEAWVVTLGGVPGNE